jgi:hypothetical protein
MNNRTISALSACITYGLFTTASLALAGLGLVTHPLLATLLLKWPIILQLLVADAAGLTPLLDSLAATTHWTACYAILAAPMACVLYPLGWWIEVLDEQTRDVVLAPRPAPEASSRQGRRNPRRQGAQLVWVRLLRRVRPERRRFRARDDVEVQVRHGLAGGAAVELGDLDARRLQRGLDRRRQLLGGADAGRGAFLG